MLKKIYKVLAVLLAGFAGGAITPWVIGWLKSVQVATPSNAVSIANTYIVFTTVIFIGVTVVLAIAGYVFTQQFSASKQSLETQLLDGLKEKVKSDEHIGIALANAFLDNPDVKRHLDQTLVSKIIDLLQARLADSKDVAMQATKEADVINELTSQLNVGGE